MFSFRRFIAVAKKEFLEMKRNKIFFLLAMLAPIILYFLFAFGFPLDVKNIPMAVLDMDKSTLSRSLLDTFESGRIFDIKLMANDYKTIERNLDLSLIRAAIIIPHDFSLNINRAKPTKIQILVDGTYPNHATLIGSYIEGAITSFRVNILDHYIRKKFGYNNRFIEPVDLEVSAWYNPSFRSQDFIIPGVIAIIMMFLPPLIGAVSLAKEKETGSILSMYCSSITKTEYILGKIFPYFIIFYINFLIFLFSTIFIFSVPCRGSLIFILFISSFYVACALALGFLVASLVNKQITAIILTTVITLTPSFLYSGFMVPVSNIGDDAKSIAYCLPATYYIDIIRKVMIKGCSIFQVKGSTLILIIFSLAIIMAAVFLFKKRID